MAETRLITKDSFTARSNRNLEIIRMSIFSGYDTGFTRTDFTCDSPKSPIVLSLLIDESSTDFIELIKLSQITNHSAATEAINDARNLQRAVVDNCDFNVSFETERTVGSLMLAHFSRNTDFSFKLLDSDSISALKLLALDHVPMETSYNELALSS